MNGHLIFAPFALFACGVGLFEPERNPASLEPETIGLNAEPLAEVLSFGVAPNARTGRCLGRFWQRCPCDLSVSASLGRFRSCCFYLGSGLGHLLVLFIRT